MEKKILRLLIDRNTSQKPAALPEEDNEGMVFSRYRGSLYSRTDVMVIVSVGRNHPPGVRVAERVKDKARATRAFRTYGKLPHKIASLQISRETAADLKVVSSHGQNSVTLRVVSLKLDVPAMQRPKEYYITAIANLLKQCRQPGGMFSSFPFAHSGDHLLYSGFISGENTFTNCFKIWRNFSYSQPPAQPAWSSSSYGV